MTDRVFFRQMGDVALCTLSEADAPLLHRFLNDYETTRFLTLRFPLTLEAEIDHIKKLTYEPNASKYTFGVFYKGELVGSMGIHAIDYIHGTATTGAVIGRNDLRGLGIGTTAKMLLLSWAFQELNLRVIRSTVKAFNGRSIRYNEKCGYREVGRLPNWFKCGDTYFDEVIMVVMFNEWLPLWEVFKKNNNA